MTALQSDVLVIGGGLAGIVTALEALRAGQRVTLVDRDTPERFGGLALWAFGGMALVGTPLQASKKIIDSPEIALRDWMRFGEMDPDDRFPMQWARHYVEQSRPQVPQEEPWASPGSAAPDAWSAPGSYGDDTPF